MSYVVICHKCQVRFDALQAPWCHCLVSERSVECPSCKSCFCKELDGREMGRRIKENPETAHVKVVLMTGLYTSAKYEHEAYKAYKVDDYLTKPLDAERLRAVLQMHLGAPEP